METSALFTDFYSLTMAQGYWKLNAGKDHDEKERAVFEMFFRHQPFNGGYSIFAGLGTLLEKLLKFSFSDDDISYLKSLDFFEDDFIEYLKTFCFTGSLWAMDEGTVVFPQEPLIRVEGSLIECQLIEGMLLNTINFQTLIATKACRIWQAASSGGCEQKGKVIEFGMRRSQGPDGALAASRAAYIGGALGTSNTLAGRVYGIPVMGTMAHSWIMAFDSEQEAFDTYAEMYPDRTIFLIDTYDTLKSGIHCAINTGKRLAAKGKNFGVRLDSGDIHYLSTEVRKLLNGAGFHRAYITVSNDLDENIIETLVKSNAPVDSWGVGTKMVTGDKTSAFPGVYKLAARYEGKKIIPVMKFSDNPEKTTNPGIKQVWRIWDKNGEAVADVLGLENSDNEPKGHRNCFWHPSADYRHFFHEIDGEVSPLLKIRIKNGKLTESLSALAEIKAYAAAGLDRFDITYKRLLNPHIYKVSITENLRKLKLDKIKKHFGKKGN